MYAIHYHAQIEQALSENLAFSVGYIHSAGRHIPVYRSINCRPTDGTLADGRPFFGERRTNTNGTITILPCRDPISPQFQNVWMVESAGVSRYDAMTMQLTKRFSGGLQYSLNYTLSAAADDTPEQNMTNGSNFQGSVVSDPTDRSRDRGNSFADQRHSFVMSLVAQPHFELSSRALRYLANHNQFGVIANANSGETYNIISNIDLNGDGASTSDRPVGIGRNSGRTPPQFNVDLRYSRFFNITDRFQIEAIGEFQNLFNINSIVGFNNATAPTDPVTGELIGPLPDFRKQPLAQESRQIQLGIKFIF